MKCLSISFVASEIFVDNFTFEYFALFTFPSSPSIYLNIDTSMGILKPPAPDQPKQLSEPTS